MRTQACLNETITHYNCGLAAINLSNTKFENPLGVIPAVVLIEDKQDYIKVRSFYLKASPILQ